MRCLSCGADNTGLHRFCTECGTALAAACPACAASVSPGQRFCGECGTALATTTATVHPAAPSAPVTERRVCSVLFCDLVGFTTLSEQRDPEEVRELLSRYFETARTLIGRYGGVVEKFIGDAVMAVWGTPVAAEGDAERAVRAALDLIAAVAQLGAEVGADGLAARAGVVTGEVAVTIGAVGQGMVAGDAVNTAARVQAAASAGGVLVDETTFRLTGNAVAFKPAGQHALKGKASAVSLWVAERVISGVGGEQRVDGLEAPMLGRDAELRLVKELFHASADRRTPRLVSVVGPAGVGKSRLGWEFEKYIDGLAETVRWHRGRCLTFGDGVAFWALAQMVRGRLGIAEEDSTSVAADKFDEGLARWVPDPAAREYIRPRLARLLGVATVDSAAMGQQELFAGWRVFFEQLAVSGPVVLLVEDIQYADAGFLDFIQHLLDWARDVPIYVLTLGRPELADLRPGWGTGRNGTVLALEPLDATAMSAMLDALVPGLPAEAAAAIEAQAQGIPLYAVETIRMLVDRDVVQPVEGVYRLVGDVGELTVPHTLQSLLAARLDALPPDARHLVADATVLGGTFPREALVAVSDLGSARIDELLAELVRREVLAVRADPLSPEQGQYGFVQALLRQVAYDTQSRRERKARHAAVAAHLGRTFANNGEEVSEVIAGHLLDALAAVPDDPDVPELRAAAIAALVRAGQRAERTGGPRTAGRVFARAAELLEQLGGLESDLEAAAWYEWAGRAELVGGDLLLGESDFQRALELYQGHGRSREAARSASGLGDSVRRQGRHDEARSILRPAVDALSVDPDDDTVSAISRLAGLEAFSGEAAEAERLCRDGLRLAEALDLPGGTLSSLFTMLGISLIFQSRPAESAAALREAVLLAEEAGDAAAAARGLLNLCDVLLSRDHVAAAKAGRRSVELARQVGLTMILAGGAGNLAQALVLSGEWAEADAVIAGVKADGLGDTPDIAWLEVLLGHLRGEVDVGPAHSLVRDTWGVSEDVQDLASAEVLFGMAAAQRGDWGSALQHGREAVRLGEAVGLANDALRWGWPLAAEAALALGDTAEVERLLAFIDAHPVGHVPVPLRSARAHTGAQLLALQGDPAAGAAFDAAINTLRGWGSPYHLAVGLIDHAEYLRSVEQPELARAALTEAQGIADRLGARILATRASGLLSTAAPADA